MSKQTKTYKIGERVVGGIVKISLENGTYTIEFLDYRTKKLVMKNSFTDKREAENYICENGTSYHADMIINFKPKK
jgi:hypothetical protein